jgi:hypothetical protein
MAKAEGVAASAEGMARPREIEIERRCFVLRDTAQRDAGAQRKGGKSDGIGQGTRSARRETAGKV